MIDQGNNNKTSLSDIFYTGWGVDPNVNMFNQIKICVKLDSLNDLTTAFKENITLNMNQVYIFDNRRKLRRNLLRAYLIM